MSVRYLTGITPTGFLHLGNWIGAIKPMLQEQLDSDCFVFIADLHGLIKNPSGKDLQSRSYDIAATWLTFTQDTTRPTIFIQSSIPEIPLIYWILSVSCPKGLHNRGHAYKAARYANTQNNHDEDAGITAALFSYPVLMAADILAFQSQSVPVGPDQKSHIEIMQRLVARLNHIFKIQLHLPQPIIKIHDTVPGVDGRKMSKSYHNTIPLWASSQQLYAQINRIVTDPLPRNAPKPYHNDICFNIYKFFVNDSEIEHMKTLYARGLEYRIIKKMLFDVIDQYFAQYRQRYQEIRNDEQYLARILQEGSIKAQQKARMTLNMLREKIGLQKFTVCK